jgi:cellulose synthase/poly-beta-1,6-N-acetylglucosamine synthase-like glycosyltransferase
MLIAKIVFWSSLALTAYVYLGYPVLAWLLSRLYPDTSADENDAVGAARKGRRDAADWPMVSLVIAAYREEAVIVERLNNALLLDYPADRLEILVGVDGEEDLTGELVRLIDDPRVRLIQFPVRRGKASVLNDCIPEARGQILIFSDANTVMDTQVLRRLVRHFRNPRVGGVCGKLVLTDPVTGQNVDGLYWKYENFLKKCEGRLGALLGMNGANYAIRKELYRPIPANTMGVDDFLIGMRIHQTGYRLVFDETAIAHEETPAAIGSEFQRRARIGAGAFQSLRWVWPFLNPLWGRVAFAFWSHKVLRWFCPAFLVAAMVANVCLVREPFYLQLLLVHETFYMVAMAGMMYVNGSRWPRLLRVPAMFVSMNAALIVGFCRWLGGIRTGTWDRTERTPAART